MRLLGRLSNKNPKPPTGPGNHHRDDIHGCNRLHSGALYRLLGNIPEGAELSIGATAPPEGGGPGSTLQVRFFCEFQGKAWKTRNRKVGRPPLYDSGLAPEKRNHKVARVPLYDSGLAFSIRKSIKKKNRKVVVFFKRK